MSDGDEEADADAGERDASEAEEPVAEDLDAETLHERLDAVETDLDAAETEADLDVVEAELDAIEADVERADLPEADDEDEEDPREELEGRLADLRERLEEERGPYAEDAVETVRDVQETIRSTEWTEEGEDTVERAVVEYVTRVADLLGEHSRTEVGDDADAHADALDQPVAWIEDADLDPDEDADVIADLLEATEELEAAVEGAEQWDDLSVREKLRRQGFYDVLGGKHKDFPPEWSALKEWESRNNAEMVLLLLDLMGDSDFIERHCLDSLARMGNSEAVEPMLQRADRRDKKAISILGKTGAGAEDAVDSLHEFVDADPGLQRVTLKALGEIGSEESTQPVANQLVADDESVRSQAARSLGLLGDPRAVEPLTDVLNDEEEADRVRASAAWALVQIGTREALRETAKYADARSYIIQQEAETAAEALGDEAEATA